VSTNVVAVVRGETIRLRDTDLRAGAATQQQLDIQALEHIIAALLEPWAAERKLEPTAAEIDALLAALASGEREPWNRKAPRLRQFARGWVWVRKTQRALHQRYGGRVIWQQTGPEAVGAYPQFLLDEEHAGHLRFPDARWRTRILDIARNFPGVDIAPDSLDEALNGTPAGKDAGVARPGRDAGR